MKARQQAHLLLCAEAALATDRRWSASYQMSRVGHTTSDSIIIHPRSSEFTLLLSVCTEVGLLVCFRFGKCSLSTGILIAPKTSYHSDLVAVLGVVVTLDQQLIAGQNS